MTDPMEILRAAALSQAAARGDGAAKPRRSRRTDPRQLGIAIAVLGYGGMLVCWFLMRMDRSAYGDIPGDLGGYRMEVSRNALDFRQLKWVGGFGRWWLVDGMLPALIVLAGLLAVAVARPRSRYALGCWLAIGSVAVLGAHFYTLASSASRPVLVYGPRLRTFSRFSIIANAAPGVWCGFAFGLLVTVGAFKTMRAHAPERPLLGPAVE